MSRREREEDAFDDGYSHRGRELAPWVARAKAALAGDSNDAEHDALFALVEAIDGPPREIVADPSNADRAGWALDALCCFPVIERGENGMPDSDPDLLMQNVADLVANLAHLVYQSSRRYYSEDEARGDVTATIDRGLGHFDEELDEEREQD